MLHDWIGWYIRGQLGFNIELRGKRHPILYTCGTHVLMEPHIYTQINISKETRSLFFGSVCNIESSSFII